jgi:hypothetical protein
VAYFKKHKTEGKVILYLEWKVDNGDKNLCVLNKIAARYTKANVRNKLTEI